MSKAFVGRSEKIYQFILMFYPKKYRDEFGEEMKYVFVQSLKDAYKEYGDKGIISVWLRTIIDAGKSITVQHLENQKGGDSMTTKTKDIFMQNKIFGWVALLTATLLAIPFIAMKANTGVNWNLFDFIIAGILIFVTGLIFVFAARKFNSVKTRIIIGMIIGALFCYIWAELAVGVFFHLGN